jgi:mxaL protein
MKKILVFLKSQHESLLYAGAALLLVLALVKPQIQLKQDVHNYLLVADVSQSMNAEDVKLNGQNVSRLTYTRHLMKRAVETSPCGTYISLGVYAAENVALLFMPLEVCANYDEITDAIDHIEWRMAWSGNSRLSFGVKAAAHVFDALNTPARMLIFTDGDEAPKVNAINKLDLSDVQIGQNVVFVGVGGHEPVAIPRYNSSNMWVGFWPADAKENGAVGAVYADTSKDEPDPIVAYAEFDRYLSQQDVEYLKSLAQEIKGSYVEGTDTPAFYDYLKSQPPAASFVTGYSLRGIYLALAGMLVLLTFLPDFRAVWRSWRTRNAR